MKRIPPARLQETAKALSGDLRLRILETLGDQTMSVTELMAALGAAQPTVSINVQILEQAGLVTTTPGSNREKRCTRTYDSLLLELPRSPGEALHEREEISMPVGLYTDCSVLPPCGLAGKEGLLGCPDDPRSFFLPERSEAELLWFSESGYVEYRFPNPVPPEVELKGLRVSAELCSEAMGFHEDWPSDITLFVNGCRIGTVTPSGDYGEEKGKLTPSWWLYGTQYGNLYEWDIGPDTVRINGEEADGPVLSSLGLHYHKPILIRFEVESDAANRRGLNLFGQGFGNHAQGIKLTFVK
ncbi:helix-turn-helix domain-containing protein [Paenibacillus aurantius]|uniref:Helix-turn-helix domain-containing protein n=1 Tax=Paenibacillus aurantius TaxID=2918900 RepID=A0AA96LD88_9BACL|nr:helix-turn-helix domain-containing protein [Paenibacillus aurantius]WNQ10040.1 helix-turn-helix domain-containing protein [Paenibacillus aurantius]